MKILHVCHSDASGGAAIGAYRLHKSMQLSGLDSKLLVVVKKSNDDSVIELPVVNAKNLKAKINRFILSKHKTDNPNLRSLNIFGSGAAKFINNSDADIVQFHWINADTIAIGEIAKINKPIVWKLPDMWAMCGAEHYLLPSDSARYIEGYDSSNRPDHEKGIDLNRLIWRYKLKSWSRANFSIVCPSKWLTDCAKRSRLLKEKLVVNIPNPIDLDKYSPIDKSEVRKLFNINASGKKIMLFAALASVADKRKGFHYLEDALKIINSWGLSDKLKLIILGNETEMDCEIHGVKLENFGRINSEDEMIKIYNTADFHVFPTQADNLPNVVKEAGACGIPCVGFDVGGMPDLIEHEINGYLAKPFDTKDLAAGINWMIQGDLERVSIAAREKAMKDHNIKDCVKRYLELYREVIN